MNDANFLFNRNCISKKEIIDKIVLILAMLWY